ncbi:hypothetical protein [Streptomyces sp. NPDC001450]
MKISALVSLTGRPPRSPSGVLRTLGAGLVGAAVLVLAGCGSGPDGGPKVDSLGDGKKNASKSADPSVVSKDPKQAGLQFSRCMRQHGVNQPDPGPDGSVAVTANGADPKVKAALEACNKYMSGGDPNARKAKETKQKTLQAARCLRKQGLNVSDDGQIASSGSDMSKINAAMKACQKYMDGVPIGVSGTVRGS